MTAVRHGYALQAPVLLRLVFHDAGTYSISQGQGGANASVRFELKRPENTGLGRGWKVIEQTSQELKGTAAEGKVSLADLVALGGAYAVAITGGPAIKVDLGEESERELPCHPYLACLESLDRVAYPLSCPCDYMPM